MRLQVMNSNVIRYDGIDSSTNFVKAHADGGRPRPSRLLVLFMGLREFQLSHSDWPSHSHSQSCKKVPSSNG
eukprot:1923475-Amphidinium_carterae.1